MSSLRFRLVILAAAGVMLSGCMETANYQAADLANFKPRDRELLAQVHYVNKPVADAYRRAIVEFNRKEAPGSIVVDSDNHYLYYVLNDGKAIRYPVGVGKRGMAWSGTASIDGKYIKPGWTAPASIRRDYSGLPTVIPGGSPSNPMGAAAMTLSGGGEYAIHGTNNPGSVGGFVSHGCIRMYNQDILDLYEQVSFGTTVVVLR